MDDKPIKIDLLRREKGLSVIELAERSGVGRRIIEDWIQKRCKTSNVYKLQKLAKVLECSIEDIVEPEENYKKSDK